METVEVRDYDVVVCGASLGGVAAALGAARQGVKVLLLAATDWVGGQLTEQGVCCPDENDDNDWTENGGCTGSYAEMRYRIREFYRNSKTLSAAGMAQPLFNAGQNWVNKYFTVLPKDADEVLKQMLKECYTLTVIHNAVVTGCKRSAVNKRVIESVSYRVHYREEVVTAKYFLDATDLGDLLPLAGLEWRIGAESYDMTGEPHTPATYHQDWVQPFTMTFALQRYPDGGKYKPISKPDNYDHLKEQQGYDYKGGVIDGVFDGNFPWWTYRRVINADNFEKSQYPNEIAVINMPSNDYQGGTIPAATQTQYKDLVDAATEVSKGYCYWLQTECPHYPNTLGYPNLQPFPAFGKNRYIAPQPYIRESRRITAVKTILAQDILKETNPGPRAAYYPDSCGIGQYDYIDIHGINGGTPKQSLDIYPFQIALGALIPKEVDNLLPASKNLGVTHLTNGAYRMHPVEWNIGEAAGILAAHCAVSKSLPIDVWQTPVSLVAFQDVLLEAKIPIFWWSDVPHRLNEFRAIHRLGMKLRVPPGADLSFQPDTVVTNDDAAAWSQALERTILWPRTGMTRAEAAQWLLCEKEWI